MGLSFIAFDFETANSSRGSACALGMTKVIDGQIIESISDVFKPPVAHEHFDLRNMSIHHITPALVENKDRFDKVWPRFYEFSRGLPYVAHQASFDMSVLRGSLRASNIEWPDVDYACTRLMSTRLNKIASHSLPDVAREAKIIWDSNSHHDAEYDSMICAEIVISMAKSQKVQTLQELLKSLQLNMGLLYRDGWNTSRSNVVTNASHHSANERRLRLSDVTVNAEADSDHLFFGKRIVFTGRLATMDRLVAWELVAKIGGIPKDTMNKTTNVLVVGEQDLEKLKPGETQSRKYREAEKLLHLGLDIEVMTESEFLTFLEPG